MLRVHAIQHRAHEGRACGNGKRQKDDRRQDSFHDRYYRMLSMPDEFTTLDEFWPFYVSQHLNPINRTLHAYGTSLALLLAASALIWQAPSLAVLAVVVAYAFAWIGHFFYEKNRPATFTYPWLSLRADFRMYRLTLLNEMDAEILMRTKDLKRLRAPAP